MSGDSPVGMGLGGPYHAPYRSTDMLLSPRETLVDGSEAFFETRGLRGDGGSMWPLVPLSADISMSVAGAEGASAANASGFAGVFDPATLPGTAPVARGWATPHHNPLWLHFHFPVYVPEGRGQYACV